MHLPLSVEQDPKTHPASSHSPHHKLQIDPATLQYAAHDMKNLLAAIRGNVELAMRFEKESTIVGFLQNALRASEHAHELLMSLPHVTDTEERREEPVDLAALIEEIGSYTVGTRDIEWSTALPPSPWVVRAVRKDLARAFTNLLVNACEAADSNKEEQAEIRVHGENVVERMEDDATERHFACITVSDNGVGINENRLNQLFKGETTKGRRGSGLGLLSTLNIVAEHGGFMEITSAEGEGTAFKIFLPR